MRFKVSGIDSATGIELSMDVEAPTAAEAEIRANERGVYVANVVPTAWAPVPVSAAGSRCAGKRRFGDRLLQKLRLLLRGNKRNRRIWGSTLAVVVLVPLLVWWMNVKDRLFTDDTSPTALHRIMPADPGAVADPVGSAWAPSSRLPDPARPSSAQPGATQFSPTRLSASDLRAVFSGTFAAPSGAGRDLSITFSYPRYRLNPSRSYKWAAGDSGIWELFDEHPALSPAEKAEGGYLLTMTAPDDPTPIPALVYFDLDERQRVKDVRFASFLGIRFPNRKQMTLFRSDEPPARGAPLPVANEALPERVATTPDAPRGLGRAGYSPDQCLICRRLRSAAARGLYSDRRGFGLCEECGPQYLAWVRGLANLQAGFQISPSDQDLVEQFKQTLGRHFDRGDDDGRRGLALFFLTGKFASSEWDALTGGE